MVVHFQTHVPIIRVVEGTEPLPPEGIEEIKARFGHDRSVVDGSERGFRPVVFKGKETGSR
jgi:hypothetical protein